MRTHKPQESSISAPQSKTAGVISRAVRFLSPLQRVGRLTALASASLRRDGLTVTLRRVLAHVKRSAASGSADVNQPLIPFLHQLGAQIIGEGLLADVMDSDQPRILFVSHEMSLTGAPVVLLNFARHIRSAGCNVVMAAPQDGPLVAECTAAGIPVILYQPLLQSPCCIDVAFPFHLVVACTIVTAPLVQHMATTSIPVLWWIHEAASVYDADNLSRMPEALPDNIRVYAVCEYARQVLLRHRPQYDVGLLPYFMDDMAVPDAHSDFALPPHAGKTVFTVVGSIEARKGHDVLCNAIRLLPESLRNRCLFAIVGKPAHAENHQLVLRLAQEYPEHVFYCEQLSRADVAQLYRETDCMICPSLDDPMPCVITEALSLGKPAICSENTGYAAILEMHNSGLVYHGNKPDELAECITRYLSEPSIRRKIAANARSTYESTFTESAFAHAVDGLFLQMIRRLSANELAEADKALHAPIGSSVSVVIPSYNAGEPFDQLLSLLRRQRGIDRLEIIVVDSGSSDGTVACCMRHGVTLIEIPNAEFSHSHARNLGAAQATGDILLFMTQDAMPASEDWIAALIRPMIDDNVAAVSPCELPPASADLYYRISSWRHHQSLCPDGCDRQARGIGSGGRSDFRFRAALNDVTTAIQRRIFLRFGYRFDFAEDLDMGMRLLRAGYELRLLAGVHTVHGHARTSGYYLRRSLVDHRITMETILSIPVTGSSTLTETADAVVHGYHALQAVLVQLASSQHDGFDAFAADVDAAFHAVRRCKQPSPATFPPDDDPILLEATSALAPFVSPVVSHWMSDTMIAYWHETMLPWLQHDAAPWSPTRKQEILDALRRHAASLIGIRLSLLPDDSPVADMILRFRKGI